MCRDPDDDEVLALAIAAQADLIIISGDKDLFALQQFNGIPILSPAQAAAQLGAIGKTWPPRPRSRPRSLAIGLGKRGEGR